MCNVHLHGYKYIQSFSCHSPRVKAPPLPRKTWFVVKHVGLERDCMVNCDGCSESERAIKTEKTWKNMKKNVAKTHSFEPNKNCTMVSGGTRAWTIHSDLHETLWTQKIGLVQVAHGLVGCKSHIRAYLQKNASSHPRRVLRDNYTCAQSFETRTPSHTPYEATKRDHWGSSQSFSQTRMTHKKPII